MKSFRTAAVILIGTGIAGALTAAFSQVMVTSPPNRNYPLTTVGANFFQQSFRVVQRGKFGPAQHLFTPPKGKIAVVEYISMDCTAGTTSVYLRARAMGYLTTGKGALVEHRFSLPLTAVPGHPEMGPRVSESLKGYFGSSYPVEIDFESTGTGNNVCMGVVSGYLVPEK